MRSRGSLFLLLLLIASLSLPGPADRPEARNAIRNAFFNLYPAATDTQLDDLPSSTKHCGLCHFDFNGGGPRNPYGLGVEIGRNSGLSDAEAILALEGSDSDGDGFVNLTEVTSALFDNTPTFPGLTEANAGSALNIPLSEIEPYLAPAGATDTIPPTVALSTPNGGESYGPNETTTISYTASDGSGLSHADLYHSDDGGFSFKPIARNMAADGSFTWFVPNRPGGTNRIRLVVWDNAGNAAADTSDGDFDIQAWPYGFVETTLRDMDMNGTQPMEGAVLDDPNGCASCHGGYDSSVEPWHMWVGSMMGNAARDPLFEACMTIAEQDAPAAGDLCIRCHSPGGWQEGRSVDTGGGLLNAKDRWSVQCDFCHRIVDHEYVYGTSPPEDSTVLAGVSPLPLDYANGQFINDPAPIRRGPYADAEASHAFLESPIHRSADLCGICHDVSSPVFNQTGPFDYTPGALDQEHPDMDLRNMFPIERTYSEWSRSEYAILGVYAPQFAGDKPDGIVSTCQDCHMRDVTGKGSNEGGSPTRSDLPLHDLMGGNTLMPGLVADAYPGETDAAALTDAAARAESMLAKAATLQLTAEDFGLTVRVINETAHKLPSGYPEGRRIWLNVRAVDGTGTTVFETGVYDPATGILAHDPQEKIYEIHPGLSPGLAGALGLTPGKSFHFVLNDTIYSDNRIPPRGFTNAAFEEIQSPPVDYAYADGQYWDDTPYTLPAVAETAQVTLYYQSTTKEYVEFLRDENATNTAGQDLYDSWVAHGRGAPEVMASASIPVHVTATEVEEAGSTPALAYGLSSGAPNPFRRETVIRFTLPKRERVRLRVYDLTGRLVRTLVDTERKASAHTVVWDGRNDRGREVPSGVYFIRFQAGGREFTERSVLLR